MDDLSDLKKLNLPFDVEEVSPICHDCIRKQLKKYEKYTDAEGNSAAGKFLVPCKGIKTSFIDPVMKSTLTDEQIEAVEASQDVVKFAATYLTLPDGTPWIARGYQEPILRCSSRRKVLRISRRSGKCIAEGSRANTIDGMIPIEDLFALKEKPLILTFDQETGQVRATDNYSIWENGIRDTFRLTTQYGKETIITDNHPFMVINDEGIIEWKELKDLIVGDYIATPATYKNINFNTSDMSDTEAKLLGYLTGDGGLNYKHSARFINITPEVLADITDILSLYGCELSNIGGPSYSIVIKEENMRSLPRTKGSYRNEINRLLDRHDLRKTARFKTVPKEIMSASLSAIKNFIAGYWDTDGWFSVGTETYDSSHPREGCEVGVGSASKQLIKDVQYLLLRLGIFSNMSYKRVKYKEGYQDNWTIVLSSKEDIKKFYNEIPIVGKISALKKVIDKQQDSKESKAQYLFIPKQIYNYLETERVKQKRSRRSLELKENNTRSSYSEQYAPTRTKLSIFAENLNDDYLRWLSSNELAWEKIISIEFVGKKQTYDLNVPSTSTIIVDNIISHNTDANAISICYRMFTEENLKVVVAAPQKTHVEEIFNRVKSFIRLNPDFNNSITRSVAAPYHELKLKNGSRLRGFAVGTKGKSEGVSIRGQDCDFLVIDELDYVDQEALVSAIFPLLQTNPNTEIVGFSTPTGAKTPFYYMCEENPHYKEFHYTYKVLPWWEQVEKERSNYTQDQWTREYLADWTASETNVYKNAHVEKAIGNYLYENYRPMPTWRYCIGTDWNEKFGTEIAVLGFNTLTGLFQVVETLRVERSEFTQLLGVSKLLEMNKKWRPDFIYIDSGGGGSTNAELIRKTAYDERKKGGDYITARLLDILKKYDSGASIEVKDPLTHTTHRAPAKPFMVNASIRLFEQERIKISSADTVLIKQLRNYVIDRTTPAGVNVYGMTDTNIGDHRLDALNLAIVAFHLEFDDLYKINPAIMTCGAALDPRIMERDEKGRMVPSNENRIEAMERRLDADAVPKTEIEKQLFRQQPGKLRDPLGGIKTNRQGWDTDQEAQRLAEFIQRRRSRGNKNSDKPTRSKF
jgi:intein/homing endonuclease